MRIKCTGYTLELIKSVYNCASSHTTSVYFVSGMRLMLAGDADRIISRVDSLLQNASINPFKYQSSNARIISGEEEGAFAWIALNYLRDVFTHSKGLLH